MTVELAALDEEHRTARRLLVRGVLELLAAVAIGLVPLWLGETLGVLVSLTLAILAVSVLIVGVKDTLVAAVDVYFVSRERRELTQLPQARLLPPERD